MKAPRADCGGKVCDNSMIFNSLTPTVAMGTDIKHSVPSDWVKPSFVIFDIRAL